MSETIQDRYKQVVQKVEHASKQFGRAVEDVKLIIVTKGHDTANIIDVVNAGASILGENYPEETLRKIKEINEEVKPTWHMIGHLQSRKIKMMHPAFSCIHSIDSVELAQKLNRFYYEKDSIIDVLLEVNIAGEESKFGFDASNDQKMEQLYDEFEKIILLPNIKMVGLMTMPPYAVEPTQNEACYNLCNEFCSKIRDKLGLSHFRQLSMGTSADFETAIKCGATYVRVGEAIMGKRVYPINR
jgi:hypothetical protein